MSGSGSVTLAYGYAAPSVLLRDKLSRIADGLGHAAPDPVAAAGIAQACLTATAALLPAKPAGAARRMTRLG
jgi:hypothetical protein